MRSSLPCLQSAGRGGPRHAALAISWLSVPALGLPAGRQTGLLTSIIIIPESKAESIRPDQLYTFACERLSMLIMLNMYVVQNGGLR